MSDALAGSLEDNVLCVLCWDEVNAPEIALRVDTSLFSTRAYQRIASLAMEHLERYQRPPGPHLRDLLEGDLRRGDEGRFLEQVLDAMDALWPRIQAEYVLEQLERFVEIRSLSRSVERAADSLHAGDLEAAREALVDTDMGVADDEADGAWLHDDDWLSFLDVDQDEEFISSGIDILDQRGVVPAKGEMFLIVAAAKRGKSWWCIQIGKHAAVMQRKRVLHVTLENSLRITQQRYTQALLGRTREELATLRVPMFRRDALGKVTILDFNQISPDSLAAENRVRIAEELRPHQRRGQLLVRWFPTSTLTVGQLNAYLDMLAKRRGFKPDVVILDYADLMSIDGRDLRIQTGKLFRDLRGLAGKRDFALVTATQGNRASADARLTQTSMVAEDWSKIGTADTVVTYSQTLDEKSLGIARILVGAGRNAVDGWIATITQSYATGQFCLDSDYMSRLMESEIKRHTGDERDDDE